MKKFSMVIVTLLMCCTLIPVSAATASGSDDNVEYTYWDQGNIYTYWSGVYNKIAYNTYKPCIGSQVGLVGGCGDVAVQGTYKEYNKGFQILNHYHYLESAYDTKDYVVE